MSRFDAYRDGFPNARLNRSNLACWKWRSTPTGARWSSTDVLTNSLSTCFTRSG